MNAAKSGPDLLPPLSCADNALAPGMSTRTLQVHHGTHHRGYVDRLNEWVVGSELASPSLEDLVPRAAAPESRVNRNAAQAWNYGFYRRSFAPGCGRPRGELEDRIDACFGRHEGSAQAFAAAASDHFGSGWTRLVADAGVRRVMTLNDAGTPNPAASPTCSSSTCGSTPAVPSTRTGVRITSPP
jgi:Fe-Mn family superoxide dismutase